MKKTYISVLSVICAIAVVMLHTNSCFWEFSQEDYWISANIIETLMYFAVPVFFMISGATLMDYREKYSTKVFFLKRIEKTVIPFVIWSIIALVIMLVLGEIILPESLLGKIKRIFELVINTEILDIYWFFISLFSVYLCIPVLSAVDRSIRKRVYIYISLVAFLVNYLFPFTTEILGIDYHNIIKMDVASGYLLYVVVGYLLNEYELKSGMKVLIYLFSVMGLLIHMIGTYYVSIEEGMIVKTFKGYTNVPAFLYSVGIFVFVKNVVNKNENAFICIICNRVLSKYTFAVYLLHLYVIKGVSMIMDIDTYSLLYRLVMPFLVFTICVGITWIVRRIPRLDKLLPY